MEDPSLDKRFDNQSVEANYRIGFIEKDLVNIKQQLQYYVSSKENDLQLKSIQVTVDRIESDLQEARKRVDQVNDQLVIQEINIQKQSADARDSQSKLQIRVLWGTVSTILTILTSVFIGYVTHLIH